MLAVANYSSLKYQIRTQAHLRHNVRLCKRVDESGLEEFWKKELTEGNKQWYDKTLGFWSKQSATTEGMLCGFPNVSSADITGSRRFLEKVAQLNPLLQKIMEGRQNKLSDEVYLALDCGCGIGRIADSLLSDYFDRFDLLEPVEQHLATAQTILGERVNKTYHCGLHDFIPTPESYHIVWIQWVLACLTDDDIVESLARIRESLKPGGVLVTKENISSYSITKNDDQNSVTRTDAHYKQLFKDAGLSILHEDLQPYWPKTFCALKMYALID